MRCSEGEMAEKSREEGELALDSCFSPLIRFKFTRQKIVQK